MTELLPVVVAAHDTDPKLKESADFVCDGVNDEVEIQAALDLVAQQRHSSVNRHVEWLPGIYIMSKKVRFK